jgi:hypothetical protein
MLLYRTFPKPIDDSDDIAESGDEKNAGCLKLRFNSSRFSATPDSDRSALAQQMLAQMAKVKAVNSYLHQQSSAVISFQCDLLLTD